MDLKLILKTFSNLRRMTSDEVAFLETLRAMNESECEALAETLSPQPVKKAAKKPASKKSPRASGMEAQLSSRRQQRQVARAGDDSEDGNALCGYIYPDRTDCTEPKDSRLHDPNAGYAGYHPFVSASPAPGVTHPSSTNGGTGATTQNSGTQSEDVSSVHHAGG